jgi:hypothetical protein
MAADGGQGDKNAKNPVVEASHDIWSQALFGAGIKSSDVYTDGNIFFTLPLWSTLGRDGKLGGDYLFLEPYSSLGEQGEVATSLGLGWRHLFSDESTSALQKQGMAGFLEEGWFVGANVFVDMLDTQHDNTFWQMGFGAEVGTRYLEFRGNYYLPLTDEKLYDRTVNTQKFTSRRSQTDYSTVAMVDPYAAGNSIYQTTGTSTVATTSTATTTTTVRTVTELYEKGMEGWDAEASLLVPWVDQWVDLRVIGGYLNFDNAPFGPEDGPTGRVKGWKGGVELRVVPAVVLGATWYEDERFTGSNWVGSAQLQIPLGAEWKDAFKMRRRHTVEHLAEPVHRQNDAVKVGNRQEQDVSTSSKTSVKRVTRVVAQSSNTIVLADDIIFVNNGGAVGNGIETGSPAGDGTAEHPVNTIQGGADIAATNNTSTGKVWNVYTQQSNAGQYAENVTITGSTNFISSGTLIPAPDGRAFGTGVVPTLMGSFAATGSKTPLGFVGITGYQIQSASASPSIALHNVTSSKVDSNHISNSNSSGVGVRITSAEGVTSTADLTNNQITTTTGIGISVNVADDSRALVSLVSGTTTGIDLSSSSTINAGTPNIEFTMTESVIEDTSGPGINLFAENSGNVHLSVIDSTIHSSGDGISASTQGASEATVSVSGATAITSTGGNGITGTASDSSLLTLDVSDATINAFRSGVILTENSGATLDATVTGNTINTDVSNPSLLDYGIVYYKNGSSVAADFNNNVISGGGAGIYLSNFGTASMTANINGNTISNTAYGIYYQHAAAAVDLNLNSNTISSFSSAGIFIFVVNGAVVVNPSVTPVSNTIDIGFPPSLGVLNVGPTPITGTIIINGTTLTPPVNF